MLRELTVLKNYHILIVMGWFGAFAPPPPPANTPAHAPTHPNAHAHPRTYARKGEFEPPSFLPADETNDPDAVAAALDVCC